MYTEVKSPTSFHFNTLEVNSEGNHPTATFSSQKLSPGIKVMALHILGRYHFLHYNFHFANVPRYNALSVKTGKPAARVNLRDEAVFSPYVLKIFH